METTTTGCRCRPAIEDKPTGSWAIVVLFKAIKRHYTNTAERLSVPPDFKRPRKRHTVVVLVEDINAGALEALAYGTSIAPDHLLAVTVVADGPAAEQFEKKWSEYGITVPLEVVQTQTGEFTAATLSYIDEVQRPVGERHRQCAHPRVLRPALVGSSVAQPEHVDPQGTTAVPQEHRGDVDPVPCGVMEFNPFDYDFHRDPYPTYEWLRENAPAYYNPELDFWAVSRFDDVLAGLHDPGTYTSNKGVALEDYGPDGPAGSMIHMDPPDHTAVRKLVARRFTPRRIAELEPRVREWTATLVDGLDGRTEFDVVSDFAALLPATVIATMLGIPPDQHDNVRVWTDQFLTREAGVMGIPAESDAAAGNLIALSAAAHDTAA